MREKETCMVLIFLIEIPIFKTLPQKGVFAWKKMISLLPTSEPAAVVSRNGQSLFWFVDGGDEREGGTPEKGGNKTSARRITTGEPISRKKWDFRACEASQKASDSSYPATIWRQTPTELGICKHSKIWGRRSARTNQK